MSFKIISESEKTSKKYKLARKSVTFKLNPVPAGINDPELWLKCGLRDILKHILKNTSSSDKLGFTFSLGSLSKRDVHLPLRKASDIHLEDIWSLLGKIYQSNAEGFHSDLFTLTITQALGTEKPINTPLCHAHSI